MIHFLVHYWWLLVIAYLVLHLGTGHAHARRRRGRGLAPRFVWSSAMGPWGSIRLPGGFRVGHRL